LKIIPGVQIVIAKELEYISMQRICAGAQDLINDSTRRTAIFCAVVVGKNLEFFDRVRVGVDDDVVAKKIGVVDAVEQESQRLGSLSTN